MKSLIAILSITTSTFFFIGCAQTTPIIEVTKSKSGFSDAVYSGEKIQVSKNEEGLTEYRVFEQAETGFVDISQVRENTEKRANKYCEQRNLAYRAIQEQTSVPPHILGNFPRVEILFVCEEASKSKSKNYAEAYTQLEVLGRLLEKGMLTKEEFESEKIKLLSK